MKRAGKVMEVAAREMVTTPSSRGWRSTSRVERLNSGSSSRKRTPWWARLTSPGRGVVPPPMSPASEMVWCGARKGRRRQEPLARLEQPHDAVNLGGFQGLFLVQGRQDGRQALGQHGLARARRADHQDVVAAGRGQQQGPFHRLLALDLAEIEVVVAPPAGRCRQTRPGKCPGAPGRHKNSTSWARVSAG